MNMDIEHVAAVCVGQAGGLRRSLPPHQGSALDFTHPEGKGVYFHSSVCVSKLLIL